MKDRSSNETRIPPSGFVDHEHKLIVLQESEVRYRRLFETAKDGILILDGDSGRITDVNPFLQDMLGYSKAELIGKALWEIGPVKDIAASQAAMRNLQKSEYIRYEDLPLETKAGERKQVEFVSNVYLVNGWRVIQCNIRDITARKRSETQAQVANEKQLALMDEILRRDKEIQSLNRLNDLLQSCKTQAEAYQVISLIAEDIFTGHNGCFAVLQTGEQSLEVVASWGETMTPPIISLEDCWALRRGQFHEAANPKVDLLCNHFLHSPPPSYFCLPLLVQGEMSGLLCLMDGNIPRKDEHQQSLAQLAMAVGESIKFALSNLKLRDELHQQAILDPLTGLFNRHYLEETLPRELHGARRRKSPLCIVMLDINDFKQFNDSYGHAAGDTLLREFGHVLRKLLRKSDILCRCGGDEFALVLLDSTVADAEKRMEQIRTSLKKLQIRYGNEVLGGITFSAAIRQTTEHDTTVNELLRVVEQALDAAKQAGRDRSIIYEVQSAVY
ncbi:MAG: diguanylate cyclase [Chloroflexi bacterium]|nr:diguanylate cyclase [Chloroflexota bacterium]